MHGRGRETEFKVLRNCLGTGDKGLPLCPNEQYMYERKSVFSNEKWSPFETKNWLAPMGGCVGVYALLQQLELLRERPVYKLQTTRGSKRLHHKLANADK